MLSKKIIKSNKTGDNFPLSKMESLLKVKEMEAKIEVLNSTLDYLQTQIHQPSNIIQTLEQKIEILQYELEYFYLLTNPKNEKV